MFFIFYVVLILIVMCFIFLCCSYINPIFVDYFVGNNKFYVNLYHKAYSLFKLNNGYRYKELIKKNYEIHGDPLWIYIE
jgi:hypothetical protein